MKKKYKITINKEDSGTRLDLLISKKNPKLTRSSLKNHCTLLLVNGNKEKFSYKCRTNDEITVECEWQDFDDVEPEMIPLDIVYEDDNYIVINKKYDMVVHPAKGNYKGTLVNALLGMKKDLFFNNDKYRPGIVHRLDKETSGLIIVSKSLESHQFLTELFRNRRILKKYHAIVKGFFTPSRLEIENYIGRNPRNRKKMAVVQSGGRISKTIVANTIHLSDFSYLDVKLMTGRTHQIRVHLSNLGYPVLGDAIYSRKNNLFPDVPLCLVSYRLAFKDKFTGKVLDFKIKDPEHMRKTVFLLKKMAKKKG
jgi:23S rRNA pseudouridine1911/1915/1917 synthase